MKTDKKKVLVVENDEQVLFAFETSLKDAGFETRTTWSARDALAALESERFDVLLTDGYLPDLHVSEFLERVGRLRNSPRVVVMQHPLPKPSVMRRYRGLGAYAVMDKCDQAAVCRTLAGCCGEASPELVYR